MSELARLGPVVALDIETSGIKPLECAILCVGLSDGVSTYVIHPWSDSLASELAAFLRTRQSVVCHNGAQFDAVVLQARGMPIEGITWDDTLIAAHTFSSHLPMRLDWVVSTFLDATPWKVQHGRRGDAGGEKGRAVTDLPTDDLVRYNAADCRLTAKAWAAMQPTLDTERHVYEHDLKLARICQSMSVTGIGVDHPFRYQLSRDLAARAYQLVEEMQSLATISPSKPASVRAAFAGLGAPVIATSAKTGLVSINDDALEAFARRPDVSAPVKQLARLLGEWRLVVKVRSTYVGGCDGARLPFDEYIDPRTQRAHYNWKPFGTVSGRLSCRFQSVPRYDKRKLQSRVREMYVAAPNHAFVYFDVSQAEMRLAAYLSGDKAFIKACDGDLHANNAAAVFPEVAAKGWLRGDAVKDPRAGKPYRDIAKNLGFAIGYGAGVSKVYDTLTRKGFPITIAVVEDVLRRLRATYAVYYAWAAANVERVKECGWMRTPFLGRIRHFGHAPSPAEIFNFPIQGGLADIMNQRTISIASQLPREVRYVAQVHDANIYEVPIHLVADVKECIIREWSRPIHTAGGDLVLPIDLKVGDKWSDL